MNNNKSNHQKSCILKDYPTLSDDLNDSYYKLEYKMQNEPNINKQTQPDYIESLNAERKQNNGENSNSYVNIQKNIVELQNEDNQIKHFSQKESDYIISKQDQKQISSLQNQDQGEKTSDILLQNQPKLDIQRIKKNLNKILNEMASLMQEVNALKKKKQIRDKQQFLQFLSGSISLNKKQTNTNLNPDLLSEGSFQNQDEDKKISQLIKNLDNLQTQLRRQETKLFLLRDQQIIYYDQFDEFQYEDDSTIDFQNLNDSFDTFEQNDSSSSKKVPKSYISQTSFLKNPSYLNPQKEPRPNNQKT